MKLSLRINPMQYANNIIEIKRIRPEDLEHMVNLHLDLMPLTYPKSKFYFNLLKISYAAAINDRENQCFVAKEENKVTGHICVIKSQRNVYINALKNFPGEIFINLVMMTCRYPLSFLKSVPKRLKTLSSNLGKKKKIELLKSNLNTINYEVRPIIVAKEYQGTAVASELMRHAESILKELGENEYFLKVRIDNTRAVNFYLKFGFEIAAIGNKTYKMVKQLN